MQEKEPGRGRELPALHSLWVMKEWGRELDQHRGKEGDSDSGPLGQEQ